MFIMIAVATGLLIYNGMTKLSYQKKEDTVVEEFKEWKSESDERKKTLKSINSSIGTIFLVLYFIISFSTGAWYITWLLFLISGAVQNVVKACFDLKQ